LKGVFQVCWMQSKVLLYFDKFVACTSGYLQWPLQRLSQLINITIVRFWSNNFQMLQEALGDRNSFFRDTTQYLGCYSDHSRYKLSCTLITLCPCIQIVYLPSKMYLISNYMAVWYRCKLYRFRLRFSSRCMIHQCINMFSGAANNEPKYIKNETHATSTS